MKIWKIFGKCYIRNKPIQKAVSIERVACFGYADAKEGSKLYADVVAVSRRLAMMGYLVVNGGGPGVMKASTVGAHMGGGKVVGVTFYPKKGEALMFEGRDKSNKFDLEVVTDSYVERTLALMREAQVYIIFQGGTGTISEFGMAWGLARLYFGHHKPLILYGKFWHKIMKAFRETMLIREEESKVYKIVDSPDEVIKAILDFEREFTARDHNYKSHDDFIL